MDRGINVLVVGEENAKAKAILALLSDNGFAPTVTSVASTDMADHANWDLVLRGDHDAAFHVSPELPQSTDSGTATSRLQLAGETPAKSRNGNGQQRTVGNIAEGILLLDRDDRVVGYDDSSRRLLSPDAESIENNGTTSGANGIDHLIGALRGSNGSCELHCDDGRTLLAVEKPLSNGQSAIQFVDVTAVIDAEKLASERDAQLRQLADNLPGFLYHAIFQDNLFLRYTYASSGLRELCGLEPEDLMRDVTVLRDLIHPDDRAKRDVGNLRAATEGVVFDCELRLNTLNKGLVWTRFISRPRKLPDGTTVWDGMAIDITEIKRLEQAMRDREEQMRAIADNIPGFIYQTKLAPDGTSNVTFASSALNEMFGIDPDALMRNNQLFIEAVHPADRASRAEALRRAGSDGAPYAAEFRMVTPHRGERWVRTVARPRRDEHGTLFWEGVLLDITEAKLGELALREREEMLRGIASNLPGFIYQALSKPDGTYDFVYVSPAAEELFGIAPHALTDGSVFAELVHPEDRPGRALALRRAARDGTVLQLELRLITPHRGTRWIRVISKPRPAEGEYRLWDGLMLDITETKQAELALRERDAMLRGITDSLPGFVCQLLTNRDGTYDFIYVSSGSLDALGISPEALLQDSSLYSALVHPDDKARRDAALLHSAREGTPFEIEVRMCTPHKGVRWVKVWGKPGIVSEGRRLWDGLVLDITEAKLAEEALRQRDEQLRSIADNVPGFIFQTLVHADASYEFIYVSSGIRELAGLSPEALMQDASAYVALVDPTDRERRAEILGQALPNGTPYEIEYILRTPHKGPRWVKAVAKPGRVEGRSRLWNGIILDITEAKEAELALRDRDARLRNIADNLPGFVFQNAIKPDGAYDFIYVSSGARRLLGIEPEALLADSSLYVNLIHPDDRERRDAGLVHSVREGVPHEMEFRLRTPNRGVRWVKVVVTPGRLEGNRRLCDGIVLDITEAKQSELALRERDEQLRGIADNLPGFIYQCIRGGDGLPQFTYASSGLRELCGIEPEALIDDSTLFSKIVYPEDQDDRRTALAERARAGVPFEHEVRLQTPKGLRWIRSFARPRRLPDSLTVWDGLILDITALKEAQTALGASEARFRQIFDENPIAMGLVTTGDYRIVQANEAYCRMLGYTAEELIERSRDDFVVPEDRGIPVAAPPGTPPQWHPTDKRFITKSGDTVYARVCVMRLGALSSGEDVALGIAIDVTEQRRAETALQQAQKMEAIGNLTGGMAHDFNNILGIIVGNLGLAQKRVAADEDLKEIVGEALHAAWRGADLTRRLLAFARRQPLRPARIEVNELIPDTVRLLRRLLGENIDVSVRLGSAVWPIMADPAQLEASLANLATNARDAMQRGGSLIIATANRRLDADYAATHPDVTPGDYVMIEVSDTGSGMSQEVMSQIFEPFFTTKETGKGTGLGLSMVFGFVKQSGGHVNVYSEPGVGTTFRLFLPRTAEDTPEREAIDELPAAMGAGETVLVVEDNTSMRRIALRQLQELGYRVLECDRGTMALEVLQREKIDLLFTDIVMPGGLDGVELARLALERQPDLAVVLTSGFPQARLEGQEDAVGNLRLLSKPYSKEELAAALRTALDG